MKKLDKKLKTHNLERFQKFQKLDSINFIYYFDFKYYI
jgi:hypothetical protein